VRAAKICQPRDHDTRVGDRLLERSEIDAWVAGRVMCDGRQRLAIGLRNVLSRDSADCADSGRRERDSNPIRGVFISW
jgi:hypothetical protein